LATERILAVDVGGKRFGLAQSDPLRLFATPIGTFDQNGVLDRISDLRKTSLVTTLVVGWPLNMDGREGEATARADAFIRTCGRRFPDLACVRVDERLTSVLAQRTILESGVSRSRRQEKGLVDTLAAAHLLQSYLDSNR
jgi:putative Holliday junction resolvase